VIVSQDRYVMMVGETTHISVTVYPQSEQIPTAVQLTLTPSSNLVHVVSSDGAAWSVPPLLEGEQFAGEVGVEIAADEVPSSGAVVTFTVTASAPNFRSVSITQWLGLLPAGALPSAPLTDTASISNVAVASISAISASAQSDQGTVLERH